MAKKDVFYAPNYCLKFMIVYWMLNSPSAPLFLAKNGINHVTINWTSCSEGFLKWNKGMLDLCSPSAILQYIDQNRSKMCGPPYFADKSKQASKSHENSRNPRRCPGSKPS